MHGFFNTEKDGMQSTTGLPKENKAGDSHFCLSSNKLYLLQMNLDPNPQKQPPV
jgi:hypothetical protein